MLTSIKLRDFRCFDRLECEFAPGMNVFVGPNAQGKTSLLEAACVLIRLQSPRVSQLSQVIEHGKKGFVVDGYVNGYHLQFYYGAQRKKLALDSVEQKKPLEYLRTGRVVWFGNSDLDLVRGGADERRRYLDFIAAQIDPVYRQQLRAYERALRSRNHLLKLPRIPWREVQAFEGPLITAGLHLLDARKKLVDALNAPAAEAQHAISGQKEELALKYCPGSEDDFAADLASHRDEDARLRQTTVGPHRDELDLIVNGHPAAIASEGQQRTLALSLRLAQAKHLQTGVASPPILLIDDIFGELDLRRRNALLRFLPAESQKLVTTTNLDWLETKENIVIRKISAGRLVE